MLEFLRSITAPSFIKSGGTSAQFLKADGSVDSTDYISVNESIGNNYIDFGPNTTWGATLRVGGNGHTGNTRASIAATNGNLNLDAAAGYDVFLNYYSGSSVIFGNGASSAVASVSNTGVFSGNGSGLSDVNAATLDGLDSSQFLRSDAANLNITSSNYFKSSGSTLAFAGSAASLQAVGDSTNAAYMSFHRMNVHAVNFGLDSDNVLKVGGWSMGNSAYPILHSGNFNTYSPTLTGTGASGTWNINASTATTLQTARTINGISFNGSANILISEYIHSQRDFVDGTIITTSIDYSQSSGDPWVLEIKGNSYQNLVPWDIQVQGYIWGDSIINYGGISNGTNLTGLVVLNVGGMLTFWFPRHNYWDGFNVKVYIPQDSVGSNTNKVTSITNGVKPTGIKEVALSFFIRQSLHSSNYNTYSPTLTGTGASGTWGIDITGNAATATSASSSTYVSSLDGDRLADTKLPTTTPQKVRFDFITGASAGLSSIYAGLMTYVPWDGTTASTGDASYQLVFGGTAANGSGSPVLRLRKGIDSTWNSWVDILTSANYNTYSPTLTGTGASGTWGINITGNAATVGGISSSNLFNNSGNAHPSYADFNSLTDFGSQFIKGVTNGPTIPGAIQYYALSLGLGSDYPYSSFAMQMAIPRAPMGGLPYLSVRYREGSTWGDWSKIYAGYADVVPWAGITSKPTTLAGYGITDQFLRYDAGNVSINTAALSTSATAGFLWISSCPGTPTGAPTAPYTNAAALVVDTTNSRLYVLVGSTWKYASLT